MRSSKLNCTALVAAACCTVFAGVSGCGNGFLGLEDYQRDLLFGGLAAALLNQQPQDGGAGQPVPGGNGLDCWDLNANGVGDPDEDSNGDGLFDALDCQGGIGSPGGDGTDAVGGGSGAAGERCWDTNGNGVADDSEDTNGDGEVDVRDCAGSQGVNGSDGGSGSAGQPGSNLFDIFVDDFFKEFPTQDGFLPVVTVAVREPALGGGLDDEMAAGFGPTTTDAVAYRVAIPDSYTSNNDVLMRVLFYRTGFQFGDCFIFSVDARRLRDGASVEEYGPRRWVRVDDVENGGGEAAGLGGVLITVDLPINTAAGLDLPNDLRGGDKLAFELATNLPDGHLFELLGVEFIESPAGSSDTSGGRIIRSENDVCCFDPGRAYISNTGSDNVFVLDMCSASIVAVVDVGDDPRGIDIAPDNSRVYVANRFDGSVSVIDTTSNTLTQTIDLDGSDLVSATEPYDVVVSPDGEWLYVAMKNGGDENGDGTVAVVHLPMGEVVAEAVLDSSASLEGIVITPDGQRVYAAGRGDMYVVDVSTPSSPVFLGTRGNAERELVASPDGAFIFAENNAIRTSDDLAITTGDFTGERGVAISPDGSFLYSTDENAFVRVVEITFVDGLPVTTFVQNIDDIANRQRGSYGIDLTDAGDLGVVSFRSSRTVRIFDTATRSFVGPPIPMEFPTSKGTIFGSEPKQLVISHATE